MTSSNLAIERVPLTGVSLIEASAGTGKTYTLAALFVRLLLESELNVDQILVVTYTRAATAELRVRVRKRIVQAIAALDGAPPAGDALLETLADDARRTGQTGRQRGRLQEALRSFDEAAIFTIHGFCQRVLRRHAFESGVAFEAELSADRALLLEEVVYDFWARELASASAAFVRALQCHDFTPTRLAELVQRAASNPELVVVPEGGAPELAALEAEFVRACQRASQLWAANEAALSRLLLGPALHRTRFNEKALQARFKPAFDALARCDVFAVAPEIEHVTPASLATKLKKDQRVPEHPFFGACAELWSAAEALRSALDQHVHAFVHRLFDYAERELLRRSEDQGRLGFEDLLLRLRDALDGERGLGLIDVVRSKYRAALIDEFQDTDPLQLQVFRRIFTGADAATPLLLIGDPKQAIYAFRGADIFAYLAARDTADRVLSLDVNRRSDPELVRATNTIFTRARLPFVFPEIAYHPVSAAPDAHDHCAAPALEILFMERAPDRPEALTKGEAEEQLPARIATEIAQLLAAGTTRAGGAIEPRQIAVLCRTNAQALAVQVALRAARIPAVLDGDASVFDSPMAEELGRWLWAMLEPSDPARVRAALATQGIAQSADKLLALDDDEAAWDAWVARFQELQQLWQTRGFMRALHALCDACDVAEHLLALPDGERRYTDLWHLAELLHEEALRTRKGPHALLEFYRRVRSGEAQRSGMALEDVQVRLESDAHAVTLTTIHKSKGLEFPIVFCPYLWVAAGLHKNEQKAPLFHDRTAGDRATLHLPRRGGAVDPHAAAQAARESLAEHARLLYVALTRAQHKVYVVWGAIAGFHESALAYLLHQAVVDDDPLASATAHRAKALGDAELRVDLEALVAAADGGVGVRPLAAADSGLAYRPEQPPLRALAPRPAGALQLVPQRISSFSSLVSGEHEREREQEGELDALDHDAATRSEPDAVAALEPSARVALADFPAGASFGHLIHAIYENADFQVASPAELTTLTESALSDYGADVAWTPQLSAAIFDSLHTPLTVDGGELPSLARVAPSQRKSELEFVFPVAEAAFGELTPLRLAGVLRTYAETPAQRSYVERLAKLRFLPLRGFLRGFIDVVVEHAGRYYVIDYKSNRLGDVPSDYRRQRIELVMQRHHYPLQALLYSVAVHRYLSVRVRDYDYASHFGGVYYLFVRGMSPRHALGSGVLFDRPRRELIEALSRALAQPGAGP